MSSWDGTTSSNDHGGMVVVGVDQERVAVACGMSVWLYVL